MNNCTKILFYDKKEPYYEFSNFYLVPILIDGHTWSCSEHYFQAMKFNTLETKDYFDIILQADSPMKIFALAKQKKLNGYQAKLLVNKKSYKVPVNEIIENYKNLKIRADWEAIKHDVMFKALTCKFTQHGALKNLLISTNGYEIIENSPRDSYWGIGKDGKGANHLGKLLMKLRKES
jgi:predicted NAD-dependent protein-ADP-ribosyltransferase YbiA (DUF1768 family)